MWTMEPMEHSAAAASLLLMWATFKGEAAEAAAPSLPPLPHPPTHHLQGGASLYLLVEWDGAGGDACIRR